MITITVNPDGSGQLSGEGGEQRVNAGSVFQAREELLRLVASIAAKKGSSVTVAAVDENGTQYISVDAFGAVTLLDETLVVQEYNELFASDLTVAGDVEPPALQPEEGASTSENSLVSEIGGSVDSVAYSRQSPFVAELEGDSPFNSRVSNIDEGEGGPEFSHNDGAYEMDSQPPRIYPKRTRVAQSASSPYRVLSPQSVSPDGDERLYEDPGRLSHTSVPSEPTSKSTPSSIIDYSSLLGVDGHKSNDSDIDPGAAGADSEADPSNVGEGVPGSAFRMDLSVFGLPGMGENTVGHDDAQSSFPDAFVAYDDVEVPSISSSGQRAELSGFVRDEDLEWGPEWIEERIREDMIESVDPMPPLGVGRVVPEGYFERFGGVFPESVLYIWRRFGFDGFGQGRSWITDPVEWAPVVDAWLEGIELPFPAQRWHCLTRTALGTMRLWGEISGPALKVDVIDGAIYPNASAAEDMTDPVVRERSGCITFTDPLVDFDEDEVTGRSLAVEGIERLGVPGADEVLGFVPALSFGGQVSADRLSVQKAVPYLLGLAQSTPRYLGVDLMAAWGGAATQFLIDQGAIPANSTNTDTSGGASTPNTPGDLEDLGSPGGHGGSTGLGGQDGAVGFAKDDDFEWGPEWIEQQIQEELLDFHNMPPLGVGRVMPEEYFERFGGVFPESVLYIWRRFGFDGFGQGRSWITDPVEWAPVVEAWLEGVELPFPPQRWHCVARTTLGCMLLWGEISGPALHVDVISGEICPDSLASRDMADSVLRQSMGCNIFTRPLMDHGMDGVTGRPLVVEGIERLGVPGADEVFGFVPPLNSGDQVSADRLSVHKAVPYLVGLAQSTPRYLGVDLITFWAGAATQFFADQETIPNSTDASGDLRGQDGLNGLGGQGNSVGFVRDEDLEWGPEWIEQQIQEDLLDYQGMPPLGVGRVVPEEYFERFGGVFPESVLYIWRRFGFDGFGQGRSWITDPVQWAPVVDAWLEGIELPFPPQRWHCVARTTLGTMRLWGEISGPALKVDVIDGAIYPNASEAQKMTDPVVRERSGCTTFTSPTEDLDEDEVTGRPLAVEGIERLGVPGADEVLGFVPPLSFGGQISADRLSVQKAVPYLVGLAQSTPRYLGVDLMAAWGGAATQFLIDQGAIPNSTSTDTSGDPDGQDGPGGPGGPAGAGGFGGGL
ncbi:GAD-like domain-containing protein [Actinomyces oris]|uniref:GAD-like domain-containing protein n=1 Tax=Actinomyces oris TaxID=544580 RepID=UPI0009C11E8C|nr:GAD-like domain-containing protein [Actinomyces oris]